MWPEDEITIFGPARPAVAMIESRGDDGFMLLDTVIALAALSAVLALLPLAIVSAWQMTTRAEHLVASSQVATLVFSDEIGSRPQTGLKAGARQGHQWRGTTRVVETRADEDGRRAALTSTTLVVAAAGRRTVTVERLSFGAWQ